jgi:hypothetical protein
MLRMLKISYEKEIYVSQIYRIDFKIDNLILEINGP